ncbi:MAG: hypothetical protein J1E83_14275 [Lachnospiraceae bacterium]|nr:hypothetical protein [Lachnospiraceae bacterium]
MKKAYNRTIWENYPSDASPIDEQNLNNMEVGIDEMDNRIVLLDNTKLDKMEAGTLVQDISLDQITGIITITYYSGATKQIDTLLEKIAVNFDYDPDTQKLTITLDDGEIKEIDLSTLIAEYEFDDTDTVAISLNGGRVSAIVKNGSITEAHLRPDYLADIKVESAKAEASANAAAKSETHAKTSETVAANSAEAALSSAADASASSESARSSAKSAGMSEDNAANSANAAAVSEENAKNSENNAKSSELFAAGSADSATENAAIAAHKADETLRNATKAESYTHGGTGTRDNEDVDNAQYYYEQTKHISQAGNGLVPMGTVTFEKLPTTNIETNAMYNISNDFVSDSRFLDGGGIFYGKGSNVYYTVDGKWDVLAASSVTGIKGDAEGFFRQGNVNISPADIGLGNVDNTADYVKNVAFALDTDTVDGKHAADLQDYNNLTNKPTFGEAASQDVVNNLTTTEAGSVLDARQGKVLNDQIVSLNSNLGGLSFYEDEDGNKYVVGADTVPKKLDNGFDFSSLIEETIVEYPPYSGPAIGNFDWTLDFTNVIYFDICIDSWLNNTIYKPFGYIVVPEDDHHYGYGGLGGGRGNGIVLNINSLTGSQTIAITNCDGSAQHIGYIKAYKMK